MRGAAGWALLCVLMGACVASHPPAQNQSAAAVPAAQPALSASSASTSHSASVSDVAAPDQPPSESSSYAEPVGDDADSSSEPEPAASTGPHPFDALTDDELKSWVEHSPEKLGPLSIGSPNAGAVMNAVRMPDGPLWTLVDPAHAYATTETIDYLTRALTAVAERFADTPVVSIGHLSGPRGGHLNPHSSHQSGRDVDVGFYYLSAPNHWYARVTPARLDLPRTWWLIRTLILQTDIQYIFIDQSLMLPLERHALEQGEQTEWIRSVFHGSGSRGAIVRHAPGHATHLHLRFFNPIAQESARRVTPLLAARHMLQPTVLTQRYVVRRGDTLAKIAKRFRTTVARLRALNGIRGNLIVEGRNFRVPVTGNRSAAPPVVIPARRTPE